MILWLVLYSFVSWSQSSDPTIEEYCFGSTSRMKEVSSRLKFILVPADKVEEAGQCLTIATPPHRRELIQNYVRKLEPEVKIGFSSVEIKREPCHIRVEKNKSNNKVITDGSVSSALIPSIEATQATQNRNDVTTIQTLKDFELIVNQDTIKGQCRTINPNLYEITIEVKKEAIPLTPPVQPGTVVIINQPHPIPIQETSSLTTTLRLNRGEKMELGGVVSQLKNQGKKIDAHSGAGLEISNSQLSEKIYLSID